MDDLTPLLYRAQEADTAVTHARQRTTEAVAARARAVQAAHDAGATWAMIGASLGVTPQRAQQMAKQ